MIRGVIFDRKPVYTPTNSYEFWQVRNKLWLIKTETSNIDDLGRRTFALRLSQTFIFYQRERFIVWNVFCRATEAACARLSSIQWKRIHFENTKNHKSLFSIKLAYKSYLFDSLRCKYRTMRRTIFRDYSDLFPLNLLVLHHSKLTRWQR